MITAGKRKNKRGYPKGRQVDPAPRAAAAEIVGDGPYRRDMLIEYLHLFQDRFGGLRADYLAALAELMGLSQVEVYETATFYHHFTVLPDEAPLPHRPALRVCDGVACALRDAETVFASRSEALAGEADVVWGPCMGACDQAPAVATDNDVQPPIPDIIDLPIYDACRSGQWTRTDVLDVLAAANLRGLGGAGFPTARKWRLVADQPGPRYVVVNADEGEPGTFKDRHCFTTAPLRVLEGTLIAAWAVGAAEAYIYLRGEYTSIYRMLTQLIDRLGDTGVILHLRRGAGAYICGEESALLESLEGKRGLPREKPPFPAEAGLFGRPTAINNVETLYWVPQILEQGAAWFAGRRLFSVSGRVKTPGVIEGDGSTTARDLIAACGGLEDGHGFAAFLPGGASGGLLPAAEGDRPLDFGALDALDCFIGSAAVVVLSDRDDLATVVRGLMAFFADESCGQCTPCRVGTEKALALMNAPQWDRDLLAELCDAMADASICGLGQAAPNPLRALLRFFPGAVP